MSSSKGSSSKVHSKVGSPNVRKKEKGKQVEDMSDYPRRSVRLSKKLELKENNEVKMQPEKNSTVLQISSILNPVSKRILNKGGNKVESTCAKANSKSKSKEPRIRKAKSRAKLNRSKESPIKQSNLESFVENKKKTFARTDSSDSCDLRISQTSGVDNSLSIEQILKDRKELEEYRQKLAAFKPLDESAFNLLPLLEESRRQWENPPTVESLNCRHVPLPQLRQIFDKNFSHLSDIMSGKVEHGRYAKLHDPTRRPVTFTCADLTYNTSMILFNYSQVEHMMDLLTGHLDNDINKLKHFFQVLLPELCLLVFMEVYNMDQAEAIDYLGKRPIAPDEIILASYISSKLKSDF